MLNLTCQATPRPLYNIKFGVLVADVFWVEYHNAFITATIVQLEPSSQSGTEMHAQLACISPGFNSHQVSNFLLNSILLPPFSLRCRPLLQTSDNGFSAQCTTECFCFRKETTTTVCSTFLALWPALLNKSGLHMSSSTHTAFSLLVRMNSKQVPYYARWRFTQCIRHGGHKINSNKSLQARKLETNSEHLNNLSLLPHTQHNCL